METIQNERKQTSLKSGAAPFSRNGLDVEKISPAYGDKFSPNLFSYLKGRRTFKDLVRLYLSEDSTRWLGYFDDVGHFTGARLSQVLSFGAKARTNTIVNLGPLIEDETFWERYLLDGRCAIDPGHREPFIGERWKTSADGTERTCLWCKKASQRLVRKERVEVFHEWELN